MCHLYHGKLLVISRGYVFPKLCWSIIMFPMNIATNWGPILHIQTPAYPVSQNPHENPQHIIIPLNHTKSPWNRHQNMFSRDIIYIYRIYVSRNPPSDLVSSRLKHCATKSQRAGGNFAGSNRGLDPVVTGGMSWGIFEGIQCGAPVR